MELGSGSGLMQIRPDSEQKRNTQSPSLQPSPQPSPQPTRRSPSSSSICVHIPCKHSRYVPGSGPPLQPIGPLPPHDSTAFIKDRILLPSPGRAADGKPLPRRMMYLVGWDDLPAATLLTPAMKVLDYVSPYALEEWEANFEQELDEEQVKLEKQKQAEDASSMKRKRERPPAHSQIEAAVVAEPETIAKAKSQPKKGVMSMMSPPKKRLRDFERLFDDVEDELSRDDNNNYGNYSSTYGEEEEEEEEAEDINDEESYSIDITPAEQMEQEARKEKQTIHEPDEPGMAGQYPALIKPWPPASAAASTSTSTSTSTGTLDAGKLPTFSHATPVPLHDRAGSVAPGNPLSVLRPQPSVDSLANSSSSTTHQQYQEHRQRQQQLLDDLLEKQRPREMQKQKQKQQKQQKQQPQYLHQQQQEQPQFKAQNHQRMSHLPPLRYSTVAPSCPSSSSNLATGSGSGSGSGSRIELVLPQTSPQRALSGFSAIPALPMAQPAKPANFAKQAQLISSTLKFAQATPPSQLSQHSQPLQPVQPAAKMKQEFTEPAQPITKEDDQWAVQCLEDVRFEEEEDFGLRRYFKVRWEGDWPPDQKSTWEPESNIPKSLVSAFMRSLKAQNKRVDRADASTRSQKKQKQRQQPQQTTLSWPAARKYSSVTEAFAGDEESSLLMSGGSGGGGGWDSMEGDFAERDEFFVVEEKQPDGGEGKGLWNGTFDLRGGIMRMK